MRRRIAFEWSHHPSVDGSAAGIHVVDVLSGYGVMLPALQCRATNFQQPDAGCRVVSVEGRGCSILSPVPTMSPSLISKESIFPDVSAETVTVVASKMPVAS